ncbi:MAG TPA: transglycosylase SLT domain-containing protein, partial [Bdellovibrionota bacterium]|nr:transglycosylase SLT domain-containing protein [Bdellovibrionota bacterium]
MRARAGLTIFLTACALLLPAAAGPEVHLRQEYFPVDADMRVRVDFWKKVYTEISSAEAFLHDEDDLRVIYKKIPLAELSPRQKRNFAKQEKRKISDLLKSIARKGGENLTPQEEEIRKVVPRANKAQLLDLAASVRCQQGLADRYYEGLVRSYLYLDQMKEVFRHEGLPEELAYLPHVESSFNYRAYSKVGAAGVWQFMRQTARLYRLKMTYVMDDRRDPVAATRAAARFLHDTYQRLGSWPLALTAYNHGPKSIEKATRKLHTEDLSKIIDSYEGRRFGFASKNFYATFVATAEISMNAERYFPKVPRAKLPESSEILLPKPLTVHQISRATGISEDDLQTFNRSLRPVAFKANVYLPKGHKVLVPKAGEDELQEYTHNLASIQGGPENLKSGGMHIVSRGESLFEIARMYRVSMADMIMLNQIENPSRVRPGTRLRIPETGRVAPPPKPVLIAQVDTRAPKTTPIPQPKDRGPVPQPIPTAVAAGPAAPPPIPGTLPAAGRVEIADAALAPESAHDLLEEGDVEALVNVQEEILRQSPVSRTFFSLFERSAGLKGRPAGSLHERLTSKRKVLQKINVATIEHAAEEQEKKQVVPDFDPSSYDLEAD